MRQLGIANGEISSEELTKNKTIIMIAHQLSTIRNADQILVLNNGEIEQRGNHEELMKQGELYKTLVSMKNKAIAWKIKNQGGDIFMKQDMKGQMLTKRQIDIYFYLYSQ